MTQELVERAALHIAIAIPSKGRPSVLAATVEALSRQTRPADSVWVAVPTAADLPASLEHSAVRVVHSPVGLTRQRNAAIDAIGEDVDLLVFLDDDTELHPEFLDRAERFAAGHPDVALFGALVVADGVREGEIAREDARRRLLRRQPAGGSRDVPHVYGCCMAVRADVAKKVRFDEALALYGWLEDRDFGVRASGLGRVVEYAGCELVHLGVSSGRQSGVRLGFQQVVHPVYLRRKGVLRRVDTVKLLGRPVVSNVVRSVVRRLDRDDRKGRLRGNLIGLRHLLTSDGDPRAVVRLP